MEVKSLYTIEPPSADRPPQEVARQLLHLIRTKYPYHTAMLCRMLRCDRQWIDQFLRPEVEHLFITHYFRQYIIDCFGDSLEEGEFDLLTHGYYFFSRESLQRFWQTHAAAERKTQLVDLADYRAPGISADALQNEYRFHAEARPGKPEKERHAERMKHLLNEQGYALWQLAAEKKEWVACPLPPLTDHLVLTTAPLYRKQHGLNSNTAAMNRLFALGAVRIKLGSRALWVIPDDHCIYPLAIQAKAGE